jgi:hypothetical protein
MSAVPRMDASPAALPRLLIAAAIALAATAAGVFLAPDRALHAWLVAWLFGTGTSVAAIVLLCSLYACGARWSVVIRRPLEAIGAAMWVFLPLFLPIAIGLVRIYPWVQPAGFDAEDLAKLAHKAPWLNVPFFLLRGIAYLGFWSWAGRRLLRLSLAQDEGDPVAAAAAGAAARKLACGLLPALGVTITFAAFDWIMSLDPLWYSTIFGVYWFSGSFVAVLALLAIATSLATGPGQFGALATKSHLHTIGNLLFSFVVFWAYIAFSQYLLVWIAEIPAEVRWFAPRTGPGWMPVFVLLVAGHFVLPFFVFLSRRAKRSRRWLAAGGVWLLVFHWLDLYWLVIPSRWPEAPVPHWTDLTALFAIALFACAAVIHALAGSHPVPVGDPDLPFSLEYSPS